MKLLIIQLLASAHTAAVAVVEEMDGDSLDVLAESIDQAGIDLDEAGPAFAAAMQFLEAVASKDPDALEAATAFADAFVAGIPLGFAITKRNPLAFLAGLPGFGRKVDRARRELREAEAAGVIDLDAVRERREERREEREDRREERHAIREERREERDADARPNDDIIA